MKNYNRIVINLQLKNCRCEVRQKGDDRVICSHPNNLRHPSRYKEVLDLENDLQIREALKEAVKYLQSIDMINEDGSKFTTFHNFVSAFDSEPNFNRICSIIKSTSSYTLYDKGVRIKISFLDVNTFRKAVWYGCENQI